MTITEDKQHEKDQSDLETGDPSVTSDSQPDSNIVDWDGPDDPANPQNWSKWKKTMTVILVSAITFVTYATHLVPQPLH